MAYRLKHSESLPDAFRRIASEQLDGARAVLDAPISRRATAAHDARKRIKKTRSLLRLVRWEIGQNVYRAANGTLREAADVLAPVRSAAACVETFDVLAKRYADEIDQASFGPVRRALVAKRRDATRRLTTRDLRTATERILEVRDRSNEWTMADNFSTIHFGFEQSIRSGRKRLDAAFRELDAAAFHELRKKANDLRHQMHIVRPLWPAVLRRYEQEVERLTDLLGEEHDFAALATWLAAPDDELAKRCDLGALLGLAEQRRLEARAEARSLAMRIYAERPKAFVRRLRVYWKAYRGSLSADVLGIARVSGDEPGADAVVIQ